MTDSELRDRLAQAGHSAASVNRLLALKAEFASETAFFTAGRGAVMSAWSRLHPDAGKGLGEGFFRCLEDAARLRLQPEAPPEARRVDPVFGRKRLATVLDTLELLGRSECSLSELQTLYAMTKETEGEVKK